MGIQFARRGEVRLAATSDLGERLGMSFNRMDRGDFRAASVFQDLSYSWPGDKEGRTLLALVALAGATGRSSDNLDGMLQRFRAHAGSNAFFGVAPPVGLADEQQLSGNSWALRGLLEAHETLGQAWALDAAHEIVRGLLLPCRGLYEGYPIERPTRADCGGAIGDPTGEVVGQWRTSTDIGCAFIMLDGATRAYEHLGGEGLRELLDEMVDAFGRIPVVELAMQTHAALSACRGLLRYHALTGAAQALARAEQVFACYIARGSTETWANMNWFGKPSWTEPCAVVDSLLVAMQLWQATGKAEHLDTASSILWNGLLHGQRSGGGFGCDSCAVPGSMVLRPMPGLYEAHWCCTMRGAEGLSRLPEFAYAVQGDSVLVPYPTASAANLSVGPDTVNVEQTSSYPADGRVALRVRQPEHRPCAELLLFLPSWVEASTVAVSVDGRAQACVQQGGWLRVALPKAALAEVQVVFGVGLRWAPLRLPGGGSDTETAWHGPSLLGALRAGESVADTVTVGELGPAEPPAPACHMPRYSEPSGAARLACVSDRTYMADDVNQATTSVLAFRRG